jgi:hypothetical protein
VLGDYGRYLEGSSPPKEGPLRAIDKWGFNVGRAWATGFGKGMGAGDFLSALGGPQAAIGAAGEPGGAGVAGGGGSIANYYYQLEVDGKVSTGSAEDEVSLLQRIAGLRS